MTQLRRKQTLVEGYKHDGSDIRAFAIAQWINDNGGQATAYSQGEYEVYPHYAVVKIESKLVTVNLIVPGSWAVNLGEANFIGVPDNVIVMAYDIVDEGDASHG